MVMLISVAIAWTGLCLASASQADGDAVDRLITGLQAENAAARMEAAVALGKLGTAAEKAVPALVEAAGHGSVDFQAKCIDAIGAVGPGAKAAVPLLIERVTDRETEIRQRAIAALGAIGPEAGAAAPVLCHWVGDKFLDDFPEAFESYRALCKIGRAAVPALIELLRTPGDFPPLEELAFFGSPPPIGRSFIGGNHAQLQAISILGSIGPGAEEAVPALVDELRKKDRWIEQEGFVFTLSRIGPHAKQAEAPLLAILDANLGVDEEHVELVDWCLTKLERPPIELLIKNLDSDLSFRRSTAVEFLGRHEGAAKPAIPALERILNAREDDELYVATLSALSRIDPDNPKYLDTIIDYLNSIDTRPDGYPHEAIAALRRLGPRAKKAMPLLLGFMDNIDRLNKPSGGAWKDSVLEALIWIEPECREITPLLIKESKSIAPEDVLDYGYLIAAGLSLAGRNSPEAVRSLAEVLRDYKVDDSIMDESDILSSWLEDLGEYAAPAVPILIEILKADGDYDRKLMAVQILEEIGPEAAEATEVLISLLHDDQHEVLQRVAVRVLGRIGPRAKAALPDLLALARKNESGNPAFRVSYNPALAAIRIDPRSTEGLAQELLRENRCFYLKADVDLARGRDSSEVQAALDQAIASLQQILEGFPGEQPTDLQNYRARYPSSRACHRIQEFGPFAKKALPVLQAAARHPNPWVRRNGEDAIRVIVRSGAARD